MAEQDILNRLKFHQLETERLKNELINAANHPTLSLYNQNLARLRALTKTARDPQAVSGVCHEAEMWCCDRRAYNHVYLFDFALLMVSLANSLIPLDRVGSLRQIIHKIMAHKEVLYPAFFSFVSILEKVCTATPPASRQAVLNNQFAHAKELLSELQGVSERAFNQTKDDLVQQNFNPQPVAQYPYGTPTMPVRPVYGNAPMRFVQPQMVPQPYVPSPVMPSGMINMQPQHQVINHAQVSNGTGIMPAQVQNDQSRNNRRIQPSADKQPPRKPPNSHLNVRYPLHCRKLVPTFTLEKDSTVIQLKFDLEQLVYDCLSIDQKAGFIYKVLLRAYKQGDLGEKHEWPSNFTKLNVNSADVKFSKRTYTRTIDNLIRTEGLHLPANITETVKRGTNIVILSFEQKPAAEVYLFELELTAYLKSEDAILAVHSFPTYEKSEFYSLVKPLLNPEEDDCVLVQESLELSLRCPLTFSRIQTPVRNRFCSHINVIPLNQCFDLDLWLRSYTNANAFVNFSCPVCGRYTELSMLCVDLYVKEVLENLASQDKLDAEVVKVFPDYTYKA